MRHTLPQPRAMQQRGKFAERQNVRLADNRLGVFALLFLSAIGMGNPLALAEEPAATAANSKKPLVVFLVRHAEKVDASRDPALSPAGAKRAQHLADALRDAKIQHLHSSDFIRTRSTAAPLAKRLKLDVKLYDPRKLRELVSELQKTGGRHLVVGHSTTTPQVAELLGGDAGAPINEKGEYDRLYVVTIQNGRVSSLLLRYGQPFRKEAQVR